MACQVVSRAVRASPDGETFAAWACAGCRAVYGSASLPEIPHKAVRIRTAYRPSGRNEARMKRTGIALIALGGTLAWHLSASAVAQTPPAPPPVQGTIALEGTMKKVYHAANVVIVATIDGVEHTYHFTKDLVVHGSKGSDVEDLEGRTVAVHYVPAAGGQSAVEIDELGDGGLVSSEGVVVRIDRSRNEITIRFANGQTETLQLTRRAASETRSELEGKDAGERVVVYYRDENGRKVAHYFKKVS
jgi:hypothetical protein